MMSTRNNTLHPFVRAILFYSLWVFFPLAAACGHWLAYFSEREHRNATKVELASKHLRVYLAAAASAMQETGDYTKIPLGGLAEFQTLDVFLVSKEGVFQTRPRFANKGDSLTKTPLMYTSEQTGEAVSGLDTSYRFVPCVRAAKHVQHADKSYILIAEMDMREVGQQPWYFVWDEWLSTVCSLGFIVVGLRVFKPYVLIAESPDRNLQAVLSTLEVVSQSFNAAELRQVFRSLPFSAVILDEEFRILFLSEKASRLMGTSEGIAANMHFDEFLPVNQRDHYIDNAKIFMRSTESTYTFDVDWPPGVASLSLTKVKSASRTVLLAVFN